MDKKITANLKNCQITLNKASGKPQVVIKSSTVIEQAGSTKITVADPATLIDQLETLDVYDRVTVRVAILKVNDPIKVSTGKTKQEAGNTTLTLWENEVKWTVSNKTSHIN